MTGDLGGVRFSIGNEVARGRAEARDSAHGRSEDDGGRIGAPVFDREGARREHPDDGPEEGRTETKEERDETAGCDTHAGMVAPAALTLWRHRRPTVACLPGLERTVLTTPSLPHGAVRQAQAIA